MAVPKKKVSSARRDKRRTAKERLEVPGMVKCPKCGEFVLSHRVCKTCGYYGGKAVLTVGEEKA